MTAVHSVQAMREHIVNADYQRATDAFCTLLAEGQPVGRLVQEAVDVTAPYVQAPSHVMAKTDGTQRGVNYDHTVLGWRAAVRLAPALRGPAAMLPLSQAMWYAPQGLDVWSQVQCDFPGHYARDQERCDDRDHQAEIEAQRAAGMAGPTGTNTNTSGRFDGPAWHRPAIHFEDHPPLRDGPASERIARMQNAIMHGERVESYRLFLGLAQEPDTQTALKDAVLMAGILDLQTTIIQRGGYQNIGHKALRARAMIDLANVIGWENSHGLFYTVVPDLGAMPRFYELWYQLAVMLPQEFRSWQTLKQDNQLPLTEEELDATIDVILWGKPEHVSAHLTALLRRGRALLAIGEAITLAFARYELQVMAHPVSFFTPGHAFDYTNVVNHWLRSYDNPHQAKAIYFAALFVNDVIRANMLFPRDPSAEIEPPARHRAAMDVMSESELLREIDEACTVQDASRALAAVDSYLARTDERENLIATLSFAGSKVQNDPHVQRKCISSLEEYRANRTSRKDDILRAWAKYLARSIRRSTDLGCYDLWRGHFGKSGS